MLIFAILLGISVALGILLKHDPGLVVIYFNGWVLEAPLWLWVVAIIVAIWGTLFLSQLFNLPQRLREKFINKAKQHSTQILAKAWAELSLGNWSKAEQLLKSSSPYSEAKLINLLVAARAAHEQQAYTRRDNYLIKALNLLPKDKVVINLAQAQYLLEQNDIDKSLMIIQQLGTVNHPAVINLKAHIYQLSGDWQQLKQLLSKLSNNKDYAELQLQTYSNLLLEVTKRREPKALLKFWKASPKQLKNNADYIEIYIKCLLDLQLNRQAESILVHYLQRDWNVKLINLYASVEHNSQQQLKQAELWLNSHPDTPELLLAIAKLCVKQQLWGKAKSYLQRSLELQPKAETYTELARLLETIGETQQGLEVYKTGMQMLT